MKIFFSVLFVLFSFPNVSKAETPYYFGDWAQGCTIIGQDDVVKNLLLIDSQFMDHIVIAFEEEGCKSPYLIFSRKYQWNGSKHTSEEKKIDVEATVVHVSYQSLTDEVTESLNLIEFCGFSDWETYQERNVSGKTCQDYKAPTSGTVQKIQFSTKTKSELFLDSDPTPFYKLMP